MLAAAALVAAAPAFSQDDVVFRSAVSLVRVDVAVSDASGRVVEGLGKSDFRIFDEGQEQPIVNFSFETEPLDLILLFDTAGSMKGKLLQVVRAVELGFHELRTGDRGCVMVFGSDTTELKAFTPDLGAVNEAIAIDVIGQRFGGSSKIAAAADTAALRFRREPQTNRRRAVLIVTDKAAPHSPEEATAVRDLWQSDAVASELIIGKAPSQSSDAIVEKTGGATVVAGDPGAAFQESVRELRRRYTLYYALPAGSTAGAERAIKVALTPEAAGRFPGGRIHARSGYVTPGR